MSDIAKWGILVAGAVVVIGLILGILSGAGYSIDDLVSILGYCAEALAVLAGDGLRFGRALCNLFVPPGFEPLVTGVLIYVLCRWFIHLGIKIYTWVYHFIFK